MIACRAAACIARCSGLDYRGSRKKSVRLGVPRCGCQPFAETAEHTECTAPIRAQASIAIPLPHQGILRMTLSPLRRRIGHQAARLHLIHSRIGNFRDRVGQRRIGTQRDLTIGRRKWSVERVVEVVQGGGWGGGGDSAGKPAPYAPIDGSTIFLPLESSLSQCPSPKAIGVARRAGRTSGKRLFPVGVHGVASRQLYRPSAPSSASGIAHLNLGSRKRRVVLQREPVESSNRRHRSVCRKFNAAEKRFCHLRKTAQCRRP